MEDTIAAISTAVGHSGIGIVRLSGRNAVKLADKIFRSPKKKKIRTTTSHRILHGYIIDPSSKECIDEVLLSIMRAPDTYTKEDVVEINCHGGPVPLRRVLELLLKAGARLAAPGEFTRRAFLNGRIDLAQAEAVLDVINSLTVQGQKTAVRQLRGGFSNKVQSIREKLVELTALVEAFIDFPEDDIGSISLKDMTKRAMAIRRALKKLIDRSRYGIILREGLKTAIIGRPNVGKSSLLNALLEHARAIVTETPGTTRDVIEEYLNIEGLPVRIMDTAGIRNVRDIAEAEGVKRSLSMMDDADLILLILDGSEPLHDTDRELIHKSNPDKTVLVINKADLPRRIGNVSHATASPPATGGVNEGSPFRDGETVRISAKKKTGLDRLKKRIVKSATGGVTGQGTDLVTNVRHVHALQRAHSAVNSFLREISRKTPPEFLAVELRDSLDAVGEILGITTTDDILERIFSSFCIGK